MPKLKFCVKRGWDQFFYQGSGIKLLGKMGLRDQNNGNKIGINGSRIYHVTTLNYTQLPLRLLHEFSTMDLCMSCSNPVRPRQEGLQCDGCNRWQHRTCHTGISRETYRAAVQSGQTIDCVTAPVCLSLVLLYF